MFDLAWSEIALIAVVALVVIGPKDLPDAIRGVAKGIQKLRRMAGEFQGHVDEMVREAKLDEVRDQINQIRNFDIKGEIEKAVDADGTIRKTFTEDPLRDGATTATTATTTPAWPAPESTTAAPAGETGAAEAAAPAYSFADTFGPPTAAPADADTAAAPLPPPPEPEQAAAAPEPAPPAFLPPEALRAAEMAKAEAALAPSPAPPPPPSPSGTTPS